MTPSPSPVAAVLGELQLLLAKATPGPWSKGGHCVYGYKDGGEYEPFVAEVATHDDCDVIVAMHTHLPRLLAAIRAVDELADALSSHVEPRSFHPAGTHRDGASSAYADAASRIRSALAAVDVAEATE